MGIKSTRRTTPSRAVALVVALSAMVFLFAPASATAAGAGGAGSGGSMLVIVPKISSVKCARRCARAKTVRAGSLLKLAGENLSAVSKIVFLGSADAADDVPGEIVKSGSTALFVRVPADAATGPLIAFGANDVPSRKTAVVPIRPRPPVIGTPDLKPVGGPLGIEGASLETGTSTPRVVFLGAKQLVRFSLRAGNAGGATAAVSLLRQTTGETVASWSVPAPDGQIVSVDWDGLIAGQPAPAGRYAFRAQLSAGAQQPAATARTSLSTASADDTRDAFDLYGYMFPVRGAHNFGQFAAKFGGGRGHQGQDIMARCNTRLVAARGGTVIESRFQSAAGNFLVIRPDSGGGDQAYMHLVSKSPFVPGDRVYTGQPIGNVGQTGRASGCHLHFEQWTGEIWRSKPYDPLPDLLAWDQVS